MTMPRAYDMTIGLSLSLQIPVTTNACHYRTPCHYKSLSLHYNSLPLQSCLSQQNPVTTNPCHYKSLSLRIHVTTTPCHYTSLSLQKSLSPQIPVTSLHIPVTTEIPATTHPCHYNSLSLRNPVTKHFLSLQIPVTTNPCHYSNPCHYYVAAVTS